MAVKELCANSIYEYAILLEFMYALALTPEALSLHTYSSFNEVGLMQFEGDKAYGLRKEISEIMVAHLKFLRAYQNNSAIRQRNIVKKLRDGTKISGEFIFSVSVIGICNIFKRKFSGSLPWFRWTPKDVRNLNAKKIYNGDDTAYCCPLW